MKILIINSEYPPVGGGASNASRALAETLSTQGHEVVVLTSRYGDASRDANMDGVRVVRTVARRRQLHRSNVWEQIEFMLWASVRAIRLMFDWRPDVSIAFFGVPSGPVTWLLKFFFRVPYIVSLRGGDVPGFRPYDFALYHKLAAPVIRFIWRQANAVVANSQGLRRLALAFDDRADIQVIPNGVHVEKFVAPNRAWQPPKFVFTGRVVYQKGLDVLLKALVGLLDMQWELVVVGDGPEMIPLSHQASDLGLADRINFVGWQAKDQLIAHLHRANIFVYPSRDEGMPNALLEAMAAGLPAVATAIAGNEELIQNEVNGLLVPPDDVVAFRNAVQRLLLDPEICQQLGTAAHQTVQQNYSWQNVANGYLALIADLQE